MRSMRQFPRIIFRVNKGKDMVVAITGGGCSGVLLAMQLISGAGAQPNANFNI